VTRDARDECCTKDAGTTVSYARAEDRRRPLRRLASNGPHVWRGIKVFRLAKDLEKHLVLASGLKLEPTETQDPLLLCQYESHSTPAIPASITRLTRLAPVAIQPKVNIWYRIPHERRVVVITRCIISYVMAGVPRSRVADLIPNAGRRMRRQDHA
jgi:hypothetical protein